MSHTLVTSSLLSQCDQTYHLSRQLMGLANSLQRESDLMRDYSKTDLIHRAQRESARLVYTNVISHTPDAAIQKLAQQPRKSVLDTLWPERPMPGPKQYSFSERVFYDRLIAKQQAARISETRFRATSEIVEKAKRNWFIIFDTLTVDDRHYRTVFDTGSTAFKDYIRRMRNRIAAHTYGSVRCAPKDTSRYHTYFAVCERGGRFGRWHIHVLHFCKQLRETDPNIRRQIPNRREIPALKKLWPYGYSAPMPVRFIGDRWSKEGWTWPVGKKNHKHYSDSKFEPIVAAPAMATGLYLTKYLKKAFNPKHRKEYPWRVRQSRNLGMTIPKTLLSVLNPEESLTFLNTSPIPLKIGTMTIPPRIWKKILLQQALESTKTLISIRQECVPVRSHVQRLLDLIRLKPTFNSRSIGYIRITDTKETAEYDLNFVSKLSMLMQEYATAYFTQPKGNKRYGNQPHPVIT